MKTNVYLDCRENKLNELFKKNNLEYEFIQLDLGDIIIDGESHKIIIERKTVADFNASLKDGRFRNQKLRLLEWLKECNIKKNVIYIFEEQKGDKDRNYWGAIVNMILRDGISVIQSDGLLRTMEIVLDIRNKLVNDKFVGLEGGKENISLEGFSKKSYNTPENCYLGQLSLIPGVSPKIAKIIKINFPNFMDLYDNINKNLGEENVKPKDKIKFLSEIKVSENRRLGLKLADKIIQYLTQESEIYKTWKDSVYLKR